LAALAAAAEPAHFTLIACSWWSCVWFI
jgi:hypothetical protein